MSLPDDLNIENIECFYSLVYCEQIFKELLGYKYQDLNLCYNGRNYTPRRKALGFGEPGISYAFSGTSVPALPWTPTLLDIKKDVEDKTGQEYNYVFLNYFPDGFARIGAHHDDVDPEAIIPTLSFGATRTLQFTRKSFPPHQIPLKKGTLLLMRPPTNQLFCHEIIADSSQQEPRISLTFHKITMPSRKRTLEDCFSSQGSKRASTSRHISSQDSIPDNDWLTKLYIDERSPPPKTSVCLKEWNLGYGFIISVQQMDTRLFVHMRQHTIYDDSPIANSYPTIQGIVMNTPTFLDFCKKIHSVDTIYKSSSVICNNQLAIFSNEGELVFAQIFHFEEFKLKTSPLKVESDNFSKIKELIYDISDFIRITLLENILPTKILENSSEQELTTPPLTEYFDVLSDEIRTNVNELFQCDGCKINDPSGFNHECMTTDYESMRFRVGDDAILILNVKRVIEGLRAKNVLHLFNSTFFNTLTYEDIKDKLLP